MKKSEINKAIGIIRHIKNEFWSLDEVENSNLLERAEQILYDYIEKGWCEDDE